MLSKPFILPALFVACCCNQPVHTPVGKANPVLQTHQATPAGSTPNPYPTINEIPAPLGFHRHSQTAGSFGEWLGTIKLKADKTVFLYDGRPKENQAAQFAVLDISVGNENLQQCADAIMRLRAEYLFQNKQYEQMKFVDYEGTVYKFNPPYTRQHLSSYLKRVFGMCGSASLAKQLKPRKPRELKAGDVFIRGGFPGHAVLVVAVAGNSSGQKIFLLAQSYMPAQDIHVLKNTYGEAGSPWYLVDDQHPIKTPEYTFEPTELRAW